METIRKGPFTVAVPQAMRPVPAPVIVLLGWAGATDRPLEKFAQALADSGYISVRCVQPLSYLFSPVEYFRRQWAISLLSLLDTLRLSPPRPIVLYAFSNGGATVVEQLQSLVESSPRCQHYQQLIVGFAFDSAPAYLSDGAARRVLHTAMPPGLKRAAAQAAFAALSLLGQPFGGQRKERFWENMARLDWGKPQLYLYSQDDPLCDADKLTDLLAEKRRRGQRVASHKWERSEHVGHLKLHRQQYLALLLPFLEAAQSGGLGPRAKL